VYSEVLKLTMRATWQIAENR